MLHHPVGSEFGDDTFLPFVIDQFHRRGLDASKICFEITETAAVASFSQANRFIQALKELGCKFARMISERGCHRSAI